MPEFLTFDGYAPSAPDELLSVAELAERLGVHQMTVRAWRKAGQLPAPLIFGPRIIRWRWSEVLAFARGNGKRGAKR